MTMTPAARAIPTLLLATRNPGKLREFRLLFGPAGWEVAGLSDLGPLPEVKETGNSFAENARIKALGYSLETELPVLGDDSGLEVFALGGRPGIRSARYAGPEATDGDRIKRLLDELERSGPDRTGRFVCALALAQWGALLCEAQGECRGEIAREPRGSGGFGYDPVFLVPELGRSFAELTEEEKCRISHRARAVESLLERMKRP